MPLPVAQFQRCFSQDMWGEALQPLESAKKSPISCTGHPMLGHPMLIRSSLGRGKCGGGFCRVATNHCAPHSRRSEGCIFMAATDGQCDRL